MLGTRSKKTNSLFRNRATISPLPSDYGKSSMLNAENLKAEESLGRPVDSSFLTQQLEGRPSLLNAQAPASVAVDSQESSLPTAFECLSASNRQNKKENGTSPVLTHATSVASTMNDTANDTGSCSSGSNQKRSMASPLMPLDAIKRPQLLIDSRFLTSNTPTTAKAAEVPTLDLSVLHLKEQANYSSTTSEERPGSLRDSIGSWEDTQQSLNQSGPQQLGAQPNRNPAAPENHAVISPSHPPASQPPAPDLSVVQLGEEDQPHSRRNSRQASNHNSFVSLEDIFQNQAEDTLEEESQRGPSSANTTGSQGTKTVNNMTPPTSLNGTPVKLFSSQGPTLESDQQFLLPSQTVIENNTLPASESNSSFTSRGSTPKVYSAIGSLEDPLCSSFKMKSKNQAWPKKQDFPSALLRKKKAGTAHKAPTPSAQETASLQSTLPSQKQVTVAAPATKSRREFFRPSSDAYTPRMGKRKITYRPAEQRTPVMTSSMGTLSRPDFSDALRRVAMILRQHVVKIEDRFEGDYHKDGLFSKSMKNVFCESNFVVPRYRCTMVRVPMARSGLACGMKKIQETYKIPTENEIYEFAHRLFQTVQLSSECSIVSLIYVERMMEISKVPLLASTWRPVFMAGLLLASKVWQDLSSWNVEFASVYPQFPLDSINKLELQFLRMIKWNLYISSTLYAKYYFALRSLVDKRDFRQRYNRMVGRVDAVRADQARQIEERTTMVKKEAMLQLSQSM